MRIAQLLSRALLANRRPQRLVSRKGILWQLDLREAIDFSIYLTGSFQHSVVRQCVKHISSDAVVLDIGANRGSMSIQIAKFRSDCEIYSIEPVDEMIRKFEMLIHDNPNLSKRIHLQQVFLGSENKVGIGQKPPALDASWNLFDKSRSNPHTGATALTSSQSTFETLDGFVARHNLGRIDLVKLDVDGYELGVLLGGKKTFAILRPVVVSEWAPYSLFQRGVPAEAVAELWDSYGYRPFRIRRLGEPRSIRWSDLLKIKHHDHCELLLIPN